MNISIQDTRLGDLAEQVQGVGKPQWRAMLSYVAQLHRRSIHPPRVPFSRPWEEIGPGYCYRPAFGHWDIVHAVLDTLPADPAHAAAQIRNHLATQRSSGMFPNVLWMKEDPPPLDTPVTHPPVWVVAVQKHYELTGKPELVRESLGPLRRLIGWYERERAASPEGFFYQDILTHAWESGVDEGVRFDEVRQGRFACVDATSHVYWLYEHAARWSRELNETAAAQQYQQKADRLRAYIQSSLYHPDTGYFYDSWAATGGGKLTFEGAWPVIVGAAAPSQARQVIEGHLMNPDEFLTAHPVPSVAANEPSFELRMWRGPSWNSMTYWVATGCLRYGFAQAARLLLERALDASAKWFEQTHTIWEYYHPHGGDPRTLQRKPQTAQNQPCPDYLGHNPLIAMAMLWDHARTCDTLRLKVREGE